MTDAIGAAPGSKGRALQHRLNNFLCLCTAHAEAALLSRDPEELSSALRWILDGARRMGSSPDAGAQGGDADTAGRAPERNDRLG